MIFSLIVIYIFIILLDLPIIYKMKDKKKVIPIYTVIISLGFTLGLLQILDRAPISPTKVIERIVNRFLGVF